MTLTAKQAAQVAKAPKGQKDALRALYNRQNAAQKSKPPPTVTVPNRRPGRPAGVAGVPKSVGFAFDGFDKRHLPVDELTAPYAVTNFTSVMEFGSKSDMDQIIVVCPRVLHRQESYSGPLTDFVAMKYDADETIGAPMPILDFIRCPIINTPPIADTETSTSVRARLHKQSIRLTCLGTNTGLYPPGDVYVGTVPALETGYYSGGQEEQLTLKKGWAEDAIQVGYIRPVPAARLVERPVTLDSAVAESVSYKSWRDMTVPVFGADLGSMSFCTSLEPILIYVPRAGADTTVVNYRLEVGQQWCSRHPHNVMIRATQKQHPATPPNLWHAAVGAVKDVGERLLAGAASRAGVVAVDALASRMASAQIPTVMGHVVA